MELMAELNLNKKQRAKKRIEELKGFYIHFMVYVFINIMITVVVTVSLMHNGYSFWEAIGNFGSFSTWLFWGIGIFFHGLKVFSYSPFFNKEWEERQIQKYLDEDQRESEKYQ
jgi:hypothetical protein